jgi:acetyl-CoA C-acetyltransferase
MPNAYIVEAVRTAGGKKGGRLRDWHPISLGAAVLDGTTPSRHPRNPVAIEATAL